MFPNFNTHVTKNDVNSETNNDATPEELSDRNVLIRDSPDSPKSPTKEINRKRARDESPELEDRRIDNVYQLFDQLSSGMKVIQDQYTSALTGELPDQRIAYKRLLNNVLGSLKDGLEVLRKQRVTNDSGEKANPPSKLESNLFSFISGDDDDIVPRRESSPLMPIELTSRDPPTPAKKSSEKRSKNLYRVLDVPNLEDDFYLNLLDWSSTNLVGVGLGNCVYLWSASISRLTLLCDLSEFFCESHDKVSSVSWSESGRHLAVGSQSGIVQVWDVTANKCINTLKGHINRVGALAWNGDLLISGSRDRSILQRDIRTPCIVAERKLEAHKQEVCGLKWSPDKQNLASGGNDNKLFLWNMHSSQPYRAYHEHEAAVKAIAWSPHQRGLLASGGGTGDRKIRFWDTLTGQTLHMVDTGSQVCNLAWSKHTSELVSTHGYSPSLVGGVTDKYEKRYAHGTEDRYGKRSVRRHKDWYLDDYEDDSEDDPEDNTEDDSEDDNADDPPRNQIFVWKYPSLVQVAELTGHNQRVAYMATSPDGDSIVTGAGAGDETLRFWDIFTETRRTKASKVSTSCLELQ